MSTITRPADPQAFDGLTRQEREERLRSLRAACAGNILEWFDWTLYATFSVYLAANFFESGDPTAAMLSTLAVFAAGFIARPLGGLLFGRLGDRIGRKSVLIITMLTMAASSLLIALIPNYQALGIWASVLLIAARMIQGLAHGGEAGVSYTYVSEIAPARRRGLWSSAIFVSVTIGVMGATLVGVILTSIFPSEAMYEYGWRIGFGIGALLGVYVLYLRRSAEESPVFEDKEDDHTPQAKMTAREKWNIVAKIVLMSASTNAAYYTWVTFAPSVAITDHGMDENGAFIASLAAQIVVLFLLPLFGHLSDRIGRKRMLFLYGLAVIAAPIPVNAILSAEPWTLFVSQGLGLAVWAALSSYYPTLLAEQIPTKHRAMGVGLLSSATVAIFGGTAPYLNAWLTSLDRQWVFSVWVMFLGLLAVVASLIIKETAGKELSAIE